MTDSSIARITGMFGVACVLRSWAQFPLWVIGGPGPREGPRASADRVRRGFTIGDFDVSSDGREIVFDRT